MRLKSNSTFLKGRQILQSRRSHWNQGKSPHSVRHHTHTSPHSPHTHSVTTLTSHHTRTSHSVTTPTRNHTRMPRVTLRHHTHMSRVTLRHHTHVTTLTALTRHVSHSVTTLTRPVPGKGDPQERKWVRDDGLHYPVWLLHLGYLYVFFRPAPESPRRVHSNPLRGTHRQ